MFDALRRFFGVNGSPEHKGEENVCQEIFLGGSQADVAEMLRSVAEELGGTVTEEEDGPVTWVGSDGEEVVSVIEVSSLAEEEVIPDCPWWKFW